MRTTLKLIAAGVALSASVAATADPLYMDWTAEARSGFTNFAPLPNVVGSNDITFFDGVTTAPTAINWGTPFAPNTEQSGLAVETIDPIAFATNGGLAASGTITHDNFPITGPSLTDADLVSEIRLMSGMLPPINDGITLNINFSETPNAGGAGGVCQGQTAADGLSGEAGTINDQGCADIFVVDVTGAGFNAAGQIVRELGSLGDPDFLYTAVIQITGAIPLSESECQAAAGVNSCVGFITGENRSSIAETSIGVFARGVPVPAPAPILGLGLGLLMMARARSRKS